MSLRCRGTHHVAIKVSDLDLCEAFYAGTLGLAVIARHAEPDGRARSIWLDAGDGSLLMLEQSDGSAPLARGDGTPGIHLLALRIARSDRADWAQKLDVMAETAYTLYVRDPEGNRVALSHFPER